MSVRVCEIALNLLDLLLSFGIVSKPNKDKEMEKSDEALISTPGTDTSALNQSEKLKTSEKKKEELSLHHFFMDSLWR